MTRLWHRVRVLLVAVIAVGATACGPGGGGRAPDEERPRGGSTLRGTVRDDPSTLAPGTASKPLAGARVQVHAAVPSGQGRRSAAEPMQTYYKAGDKILEVRSKPDGTWEAEVAPGRYVVRAFAGERSFSAEVVVEVGAGQVRDVELLVTHGV